MTIVEPRPTPSLSACIVPPCAGSSAQSPVEPLDDRACDEESRANPALPTRRRCVAGPKEIEYVRQICGGDPFSGVPKADDRLAVLSREIDVDVAARWRELDRVRESVGQGLPDALPIGARRRLVRDAHGERDAALRRFLPELVDARADQRAEAKRLELKVQLAAQDARSREKLVHEARLLARASQNRLEAARQAGGVLAAIRLERLRPRDEPRQGRPQLVRHDANELLPLPGRPLGRRARAQRRDREGRVGCELLEQLHLVGVEAPSAASVQK